MTPAKDQPMKKTQDQSADAAALRRRAEERLGEQRKSQRSDAGDPGTAGDTARLIHELQVHQIELEMQNEELRQAHTQAETLLAQYTDLYDSAPAGYMTLDREGAIRQVNLTDARLLGVERSGLVNHRFGLFVAEGDRRAFSDFLQKVFASEAKESCELTLLHESSQPVVVQIEGTRSADGQECRAVMLEITERKHAEELLHHEQTLMATLMENIPDGVYFKDTASRFLRVNSAQSRKFGLSDPAQIVGKSDADFFSGEHARQALADEQEIIRTGRPLLNVEEKETWPDGTVGWVLTTKLPLRDAAGRIIGTCGISRDITERKRAEAALIRLAAIVESSDDAIVGKDLNGIITNWNKGAEKIYGHMAREVVGTSIMRLIPADRHDEEGQIMEKIKRGESMKPFETLRQTKDGRLIDVSVTVSPIRDATDKIIGVSNVARDITERRKLEAQLRQSQKMEAVGQLAGGVAHDFNNILAVIQMQSGLLKAGGNLSPAQLDSTDGIGAATQRAAMLTRQLLRFSRKENSQLRDLDLNRSINEMLKMLRRILGEDIQLQFKFDVQSLFVHADAGMIDQVLMNLAVNARDAMPKGGQFIIETSAVDFDKSVRAQSGRAGSGSLVCLSVSDTGCGIPPEVLPRIFEPFFTTKEAGKGTGLGLATVFGIVEQHQGWINVHSEVGHGTTFHIYLPQLTKISRQKPEQPTSSVMCGGNETILLVEDDVSLRASTRKILSQLGYRVLEAVNGVEALEVWKQNRDGIHLMLADLLLPGGMTGKDLGERLLKENPKLKVIYASGHSIEIAGKGFPLEEGVNFLTKPFQAQKLAQTVRACLKNRG